jgi:DNA replication and repair protein RecF
MTLAWLQAARFRNLEDTRLDLSPGLNLLYGENGSGKTSLLEASYFLSSARSFRSSVLDPVIQKGQVDCLVRGRVERQGQGYQIGISRSRQGEREIRVNSEDVARATDLARLLPTLNLGPESVDLLIGAPIARRRFLNWGLFHVEHGFGQIWDEANRCLRQRNILLRAGTLDRKEIESWSTQLAIQAERLDQARKNYVDQYRPLFSEVVLQLTGMTGVGFDYYRGWDREGDLREIYGRDLENDQKRGFTQKGFQRADVRITLDGQPAVKVCSRGELKALVWGMILAQGRLLTEQEQQDTLYLVDDLASEFDEEHRRRVCRLLVGTTNQAKNQVMMTGVDRDSLVGACEEQYECMFHVKHGEVEVR